MPFNYVNLQQFSFTIDKDTTAAPVEISSPILGHAVSLPAHADTSLEHFTGSSSVAYSVATFDISITDGVVLNPLRFGGGLVIEYSYVPHDFDIDADRVEDGEFDNGLNSWETGGDGSADVVNQPPDSANQVIHMTTSSPVTLEQLVDLPDEPFRIEFDYAFLTTEGDLTVMLGSQVVGTVSSTLEDDPDFGGEAGFGTFAEFERFRLSIDDPTLLELGNETPLTLALDGPGDSQVIVDNVVLAPILSEVDPPPAPEITDIERQGDNLILEWTGSGVVQQAESPEGPWEDQPNLSSPATIPMTETRGFFRIVVE